MHPNLRKIIFVIFLIGFLISAPLLILYSLGYRFNPKKNKVQSVGALFLESTPKNAQIYLNGELSTKSMPAKFVDLLPGTYDIRIEKDNYFSWEKELDVYSKQTTFADNIVLFEKNEPQQRIDKKINIFSPSPNNRYILYSILNDSWEELWILDTEVPESKGRLLYRLSHTDQEENTSAPEINWAPDNTKILIHYKNSLFVLSINESAIFIDDITDVNFNAIKWDNRNPAILYGIENKNVYRININQLTSELVDTIPVSGEKYTYDYLVKNGALYYFNEGDNLLRLERISLNDDSLPSYIIDVEKVDDIHIVNHNENYISINSRKLQKLYLLKIDTDKISYQTLPAHTLLWNNTNTKILYYNDFELWSADTNNDDILTQQYLITRLSDGIESALWHANSEYLLFSTRSSIQIVELDGRDKRNTITVIDNIPLKLPIAQDQNSYKLFYYLSSEDKDGLYSLQINQSYNPLIESFGL